MAILCPALGIESWIDSKSSMYLVVVGLWKNRRLKRNGGAAAAHSVHSGCFPQAIDEILRKSGQILADRAIAFRKTFPPSNT